MLYYNSPYNILYRLKQHVRGAHKDERISRCDCDQTSKLFSGLYDMCYQTLELVEWKCTPIPEKQIPPTISDTTLGNTNLIRLHTFILTSNFALENTIPGSITVDLDDNLASAIQFIEVNNNKGISNHHICLSAEFFTHM